MDAPPLILPPIGPWLGNSKKIIHDALYGPSKELPRNSQGYEPIEAYFPHLNPDYNGPKAFDSDSDSDDEMRRHVDFVERRKKELLKERENKRKARARAIEERKKREKLREKAIPKVVEVAAEPETDTAEEAPEAVAKDTPAGDASITPKNRVCPGGNALGASYTKTVATNKTLPTITQEDVAMDTDVPQEEIVIPSSTAEESAVKTSPPLTESIPPSRLSFGDTSEPIAGGGKPEVKRRTSSRRKSSLAKKIAPSQSTIAAESEGETRLQSSSRVAHTTQPLNSTSISTARKSKLRPPKNWSFSTIRPSRSTRSMKELEEPASSEKQDEQQNLESSEAENMDVSTHSKDPQEASDSSLNVSQSSVRLKRLSIEVMKMSPVEIKKKTRRRKTQLTIRKKPRPKQKFKITEEEITTQASSTASTAGPSHIDTHSASKSKKSNTSFEGSSKHQETDSEAESLEPENNSIEPDPVPQEDSVSIDPEDNEEPLADVSLLGSSTIKRKRKTKESASKRSKTGSESSTNSDADLTHSPFGGRTYRRKVIQTTKKTPGVRRSKRNRIAPVKPWLNEKVEYEMRRKSGVTLKGVLYPTYDIDEVGPRKSKGGKRKTKSKQSKSDEEQDSMVDTVDDDYSLIEIEYDNGESHSFKVVRTLASTEALDNDTNQTATEASDITIHRLYAADEGTSGTITFKPMSMKKRALTSTNTMNFYIVRGKFIFHVEESTYLVGPKMLVSVPPQCEYDVRNITSQEGFIYYNTFSMALD